MIPKWFVKYFSFPLLAERDGIPNLQRLERELELSQYWERQRLLEMQQQHLKKLLIHAYENTEFYRRRIDDAGLNPYTFNYPDELNNIPILTKKQIRDHLPELIARNHRANDLHSSETGGTTGVKMKFFRDNKCLAAKEASLYRFEKWAGWDFGEWMGLVWTAQQDYVGHWTAKAKVKNAFYRKQVVFPAAIIDDASCNRYVQQITKKRPSMIRAFSSPLFELAKFMEIYGINDISLKGVVTTGEPLYPHQRDLISRVFHCEVFDSYRSREAGPVAQECEIHDGLHINAESLFIEVDFNRQFTDFGDGVGELIITDLLNYGMPLIRYQMGDLGSISDELCPCGRGLPLLKKVMGRTADTFITPDNKRVTAGSLVLYLVDEAPGLLGQVQIIQDKKNHLLIRMTKDPLPTNEIMQYQVRTIKRLFGEKMRVDFELVDEIHREKSGKYLFTKCLVSTD